MSPMPLYLLLELMISLQSYLSCKPHLLNSLFLRCVVIFVQTLNNCQSYISFCLGPPCGLHCMSLLVHRIARWSPALDNHSHDFAHSMNSFCLDFLFIVITVVCCPLQTVHWKHFFCFTTITYYSGIISWCWQLITSFDFISLSLSTLLASLLSNVLSTRASSPLFWELCTSFLANVVLFRLLLHWPASCKVLFLVWIKLTTWWTASSTSSGSLWNCVLNLAESSLSSLQSALNSVSALSSVSLLICLVTISVTYHRDIIPEQHHW